MKMECGEMMVNRAEVKIECAEMKGKCAEVGVEHAGVKIERAGVTIERAGMKVERAIMKIDHSYSTTNIYIYSYIGVMGFGATASIAFVFWSQQVWQGDCYSMACEG